MNPGSRKSNVELQEVFFVVVAVSNFERSEEKKIRIEQTYIMLKIVKCMYDDFSIVQYIFNTYSYILELGIPHASDAVVVPVCMDRP